MADQIPPLARHRGSVYSYLHGVRYDPSRRVLLCPTCGHIGPAPGLARRTCVLHKPATPMVLHPSADAALEAYHDAP